MSENISMAGRRTRNVGRVAAFSIEAPPLDEKPSLSVDGVELRIRRQPSGTSILEAVDAAESVLGVLQVHWGRHVDRFYGEYSRPDEHHCYCSGLEVDPAARGRKLGQQLMRAGRGVAYAEGGRGLKAVAAIDNHVSIHCNTVAGILPTLEMRGVRLGSRVVWWSKRPVA